MKTLFVCISDIHLREDNKNSIKVKLNRVLEKINAHVLLKQASQAVVLFPGDIAYSGKGDEYSELDEIIERFKERYTLIFSPGNHDHDFSVYNGNVREQLLKTEISQMDEYVIRETSKGLERYLNFESKHSNATSSGNETILSKEYVIDAGSQRISITRISTAWCSRFKERGGGAKNPIVSIDNTVSRC